MTKELDEDLKTLINVGSVIILEPIVILKQGVIVISLKKNRGSAD